MLLNKNIQENYTKLQGSRQLVLPLDYGLMIAENEPVRLLDAVLEELNYTKLQRLYSSKGRKSAVPPDILFKVYCFAMLEGVYSSRAIQRQCEVNLQYKWLLQGYSVPSHMAFQRFFSRMTLSVLKDLFSQFITVLSRLDSINFAEVFIDGTKLEANANRYTFIWKKKIQRELNKIPGKLESLTGEIFRATGEDLRACSDELLLHLLQEQVQALHITFVYGKGSRKTQWQRWFERCEEIVNKRHEYERHLEILGERNSYSKTDPDATFMRLKEDHMLNGQLKPAYNIQLAVHSEYILGVGVYANPTDVNTLIPFMKELGELHDKKFSYVVADAGYDSYENFDWLQKHNYASCIKPQNHERDKKKSYREDIGRAENMTYSKETDTYTCAKGRKLTFKFSKKTKKKSGVVIHSRIYECGSCNKCGLRSKCQKPYKGKQPKNNKRLYISTYYNLLQKDNLSRFTTEYGTLLRVNRSIQVEGAFGVIKQDYRYKRMLRRGKENVEKDLYFIAFGFNLRKLYNRIQANRIGQSLFAINEVA